MVYVVLALVLLGLATALLIRSQARPTQAGPPQAQTRPAVEPEPIQPWRASSEAPFTAERLEGTIAAAAAYLVRFCDKDGRFTYRVNIDPSIKVEPAYNIVRHAGTIYAMATYAQRRPEESLLDALRRAAHFLRRETIGPIDEHEELLAVWSKPDLEHTDRPLRAQLGAAGLGLVGLVCVERVAPGTTPLEELRALGRFVLYMTDDDGRTYTEYIPSDGGRSDKRVVLYYPGEAALGLIMLYELDPSPEWLDGAARMLGWLARRRAGQRHVEPDHWALLATARLMPHYDRLDQPPVSRAALVHHAVQICTRMLGDRKPQPADAVTAGCLSASGSTCPTATRLEGLLAALTFLPEDEYAGLRAQIETAGCEGVAFLVRSQIVEGPYCGGIPRAPLGAGFPAGQPRHNKKPNAAATEIRIDFVQHAMSAMMHYADNVLADDTE